MEKNKSNDKKRTYRMAFDIGIGSCGHAVVSEDENGVRRIEEFGTRIFDSGENEKRKSRKSQERRGFRSVRRVLRRRFHRKELVKNYLRYVHFMKDDEIRWACETMTPHILPLKVKGLDEKLSKAEILQVLIHTCNHRGYKDFYDVTESAEEVESKEAKQAADEEKVNQQAANRLDKALADSGCRTISEYICQHCTVPGTDRIDYRNRSYKNEERMIIRRKHMEKEMRLLLKKQQSFYPELSDGKVENILGIVFAQRDFEDGPGDANNPYRRYTGFLETIGYCRFYPEERRGFRNTVLGDLYGAINALSQYRYIHTDTGESRLTAEAARAMVAYILENGSITRAQAGKILKPLHMEITGSKDIDKTLNKSFRYLKEMKKMAEKCQVSWESLTADIDLAEEFSDDVCLLDKLGDICSTYQTPHRKEAELKKFRESGHGSFLPDSFWKALKGHKFNGTSSVSYHFMKDAIEAFLQGDVYGNFQWEREAAKQEAQAGRREFTLSPKSLLDDEDLKDNPVVYRSINETRKVLNALIRLYGSPTEVHIEVADDVAKSFIERARVHTLQKANEKKNDDIRKKIAEILKCSEKEVKGSQIERYKLYLEQEGKCMYSGRPLILEEVLDTKNHAYEVDHIVPYSLILDNTLANKALVYGNENQVKEQKTPLMYLQGEKKEAFIARVTAARKRKVNPISNKKYDYLMLPTLLGDKARDMLAGWKSRNINDTRYITKYVVGLVKNHLQFAGEKPKVFGIRGHITSRFRKEWLGKNTWGSDEKCRDNYLNHAADAVVLANLSQLDVEIAMDYEKLHQILRHYNGIKTIQYDRFLKNAVERISSFYHVPAEKVQDQLTKSKRTPSYIPDLGDEVDLRFGPPEGDTRTPEKYKEECEKYYQGADFLVPPHLPITSTKPLKKFSRPMADANPIRLLNDGGAMYKISRTDIGKLKAKDLGRVYTSDQALLDSLRQVFIGKPEEYTVGKYMEEQGISAFRTTKGQVIRKVSLKEKKPISSYYRKQIDMQNYTFLGGIKYYCVEIYKDDRENTQLRGLRFVDMVLQDGKLYLKGNNKPVDYKEHVMYVFPGEYIEVEKKGKIVYAGIYQNAYNINQNKLSIKPINQSTAIPISISAESTVRKYEITIDGRKGGEVKEGKEGYPCFAPCLSKKEND